MSVIFSKSASFCDILRHWTLPERLLTLAARLVGRSPHLRSEERLTWAAKVSGQCACTYPR